MSEEEKPKKKEKDVVVVENLPTQSITEYERDGVVYELVTRLDAETEMLKKIREIHKSVA